MKIKYLIIVITVILIGIGGALIMRNKRKPIINNDELEASNIKSIYLTYTNGYMMNAYTRYQLIIENDKYIAKIKPYGVDENDILEIEVSKDLMEEISKVLKKYEVGKWDGFDKTDQGVLDGDSFSFSVLLNNDKDISASGYMKWPKNYGNVVGEISLLFMNIYNKEKGINENE